MKYFYLRITPDGISSITIFPAEIITLSPILTPSFIIHPLPMKEQSPILTPPLIMTQLKYGNDYQY